MDIKSIIARIASDADMRMSFIRNVPRALDDYFVSGSGELLTKQEADKLYTNNYFLDGLDFISSQLNLV